MTKTQKFSYQACLCALLTLVWVGSAAAQSSQVIETLPARSKILGNDAASAAARAQALIEQSRLSGEHELARQAQMTLSAWWNQTDAPAQIVLLQATIEQYLHEFTQAKATLQRLIKMPQATGLQRQQALLTLAALEKLAGQYQSARGFCLQMKIDETLSSSIVPFSAMCVAELDLLQGRDSPALGTINKALQQVQAPALRAWLLSMKAEHIARQGFAEKAIAQYVQIMRLHSDTVTRIELADLYLKTKQPQLALAILQPSGEPELLRIALAQRQSGLAAWTQTKDRLAKQFAAQDLSRVSETIHARERALFYWWLDDNLIKAGHFAKLNLQTQRESIDWWIAQEVFSALGQRSVLADLKAQQKATGLRDQRLL
jgi:tetratricopeptide (TPR) repeat protein